MGIEVIKDEDEQRQFDATEVRGLDPAYHYRWIRKDAVNVTRQKLKGYEPVVRDDKLQHVVDDRTKIKKPEDVTTALEWGDMILMRTTKENHERRLAQKRARILRQTKGVTQAYRAALARMSQANNERDLGFEEHTDKRSGYTEEMSETEFVKQMESTPENEGPHIGVKG